MKKIIYLFACLSMFTFVTISPHAPSYADERGDEDHTHDDEDFENFDLKDLTDEELARLEEDRLGGESDIPADETARERRKRKSEEVKEFRDNTRERRRAQKEEARELRKNRGTL